MEIYLLMQHLDSNNQSSSLPLKAFHNQINANADLQQYNSSLVFLKGLKTAYERLLKDWIRRHDNNPNLLEDLEKEKAKLITILELDSLLEKHGISIDDNFPKYYLVKVELN